MRVCVCVCARVRAYTSRIDVACGGPRAGLTARGRRVKALAGLPDSDASGTPFRLLGGRLISVLDRGIGGGSAWLNFWRWFEFDPGLWTILVEFGLPTWQWHCMEDWTLGRRIVDHSHLSNPHRVLLTIATSRYAFVNTSILVLPDRQWQSRRVTYIQRTSTPTKTRLSIHSPHKSLAQATHIQKQRQFKVQKRKRTPLLDMLPPFGPLSKRFPPCSCHNE